MFGKSLIHGLAHITGGGICENLNRILPEECDAEIDLNNYEVLDVFKVLRKYGDVDDTDMLRTFNLGVGMALVTSKENESIVMNHLTSMGVKCYKIGKIVPGTKKVKCKGKLVWD